MQKKDGCGQARSLNQLLHLEDGESAHPSQRVCSSQPNKQQYHISIAAVQNNIGIAWMTLTHIMQLNKVPSKRVPLLLCIFCMGTKALFLLGLLARQLHLNLVLLYK